MDEDETPMLPRWARDALDEAKLQKRRNALLLRIGRLWQGDWSGHVFDGRDGSGWIDTAVNGEPWMLDELERKLQETEESY